MNSDEEDERGSSRWPGNSWGWGGVGVSIEELGVGGGGTIEEGDARGDSGRVELWRGWDAENSAKPIWSDTALLLQCCTL